MDNEATENVMNDMCFLNITQKEKPSRESDKFVYKCIRNF